MTYELVDLLKNTIVTTYDEVIIDEGTYRFVGEKESLEVIILHNGRIGIKKRNKEFTINLIVVENEESSLNLKSEEHNLRTTLRIRCTKLDEFLPEKIEVRYDILDDKNIIEHCAIEVRKK